MVEVTSTTLASSPGNLSQGKRGSQCHSSLLGSVNKWEILTGHLVGFVCFYIWPEYIWSNEKKEVKNMLKQK